MVEVSKNTGTFESFDGTPIYFESRGSGPPILFLYGIACSTHHWRHQIQYFSKNFRVITMDYRGHQRTPSNGINLSIQSLAEDAALLLQHLGLKSAHILTHSFGSQIALAAYKNNPNIFKSLVLVNGFASNPLRQMFGNRYTLPVISALRFGTEKTPLPLSWVWKKLVTHPVTLRLTALSGGFNLQLSSLHDIEVYSKGVASMNLSDFTNLFEEMITYDAHDVLPKIDVPVLIIGGSKDTVTPIEIQKEMAELIPEAEFLAVPFGSHCTPLDMPELVNLRIEKFLRKKPIPLQN